MSRHYKLSKSKLLAFRQCPKRLWLQTHRPDLADYDVNQRPIVSRYQRPNLSSCSG
jgi:hypothetical protein